MSQNANSSTAATPTETFQPEPHHASYAQGAGALLPHHREHLHGSGLSDETIRRRGYRSCDDATGRKLLNWPPEMRGDTSGLVIPYRNVPGYVKVRTDHPRSRSRMKAHSGSDHDYGSLGRDEYEPEVVKYEAPLESPAHIYVPLDICPAIADPKERLYITEGEKKADLMCQQGQPCISIPGVSSAHDVEHRREAQDFGGSEWKLSPELLPYVLPGREVCLLFDTPDMEKNLNVIRACVRTARMVIDAGAVALVGYVPSVAGQKKTGVDDFFVATMKRARATGSMTYNPLACDFAEARPAGPNKLVEWLKEQRDEGGWDRDMLLARVRLAAIWTRVWHERKEKNFGTWVRSAARAFYLNPDDIEEMVAYIHPPRDGENRASPWQGFDDQKMLEHCIPLLNKSYRLLGQADGTERVFHVSERNEATLQLCDANQRRDLHDGLKAEFGAIPPERLLDASIVLWKKETIRLAEEPEPFCFAGDNRICFKRFDWEPAPGPFPAWEEFLSRTSDRDALMAFVWSCFEKQSKSRQYLWARGEGQDGKSTVTGIIHDVFGTAAVGINNAHVQKGSQFFFSALYGKRVCVYPDCKNPRFGMTEIVRNCTSGDPVPIEFKGETPFTVRLRVKLFIGSNHKPEFTSQAADKSRIIYIEVAESTSKDDPGWEDRLKAELPGFLWSCRETYRRVCPHHGDIPLSSRTKELLDNVATGFEDEFHNIFEACFKAVPGEKTPAKEVALRLKERLKTNEQVSDFKAWMERVHRVCYRKTNEGRFYLGLALAKAGR